MGGWTNQKRGKSSRQPVNSERCVVGRSIFEVMLVTHLTELAALSLVLPHQAELAVV